MLYFENTSLFTTPQEKMCEGKAVEYCLGVEKSEMLDETLSLMKSILEGN